MNKFPNKFNLNGIFEFKISKKKYMLIELPLKNLIKVTINELFTTGTRSLLARLVKNIRKYPENTGLYLHRL